MLKRASNNGIFILTKSKNWYPTLAYQKQRLVSRVDHYSGASYLRG